MKRKYQTPWKHRVYLSATIFAAIFAAATAGFFFMTDSSSQGPARLLLVIWSVIPPLWFWVEYFFMWKTEDEAKSLKAFKYGHEDSRNIWLVFVALLVALYVTQEP